MSGIDQYAVYQLKNIAANRKIRWKPYSELQAKGIKVDCENYEKVYSDRMETGDTLAAIRVRLSTRRPKSFTGHSISVSDVFVLNQNGSISSFYVEEDGFVELPFFFKESPSGTDISIDTTDFQITGKDGKWLAYDSLIIEGCEFFLMERSDGGFSEPCVILDKEGKLIVDNVRNGFDEYAKHQIAVYIGKNRSQHVGNVVSDNWQKAYENGEYLRSAEMAEEQNYNMIDGRMNNYPKKLHMIGGRISVRERLRLKQAWHTEKERYRDSRQRED